LENLPEETRRTLLYGRGAVVRFPAPNRKGGYNPSRGS
jgi:hypothetical protein